MAIGSRSPLLCFFFAMILARSFKVFLCFAMSFATRASPAYTTPGTIQQFFSAAPAAVVATPSAVVAPVPALSYSSCLPTVGAALAHVWLRHEW